MNKVILMGRLTKDPELRYTANSTPVCSFTLAVNRMFKKDEADFINCQAWKSSAEFISKYFQKGSSIAVVGRIQNRSWEDKEGKKHIVTEVIVEEQYFAGDKKEGQKPQHQQDEFSINDDDELPF